MAAETAARIATLGVSLNSLPGAPVQARDWNDYSAGRAAAAELLATGNIVDEGVISSHRDTITATGELVHGNAAAKSAKQ
ncbi:hypothetical protein [Arthrobacter sp. HLT1-20]